MRYKFAARIYCAFEIEADTEEEAIAALEGAQMETGNLGVLPDGSPIIARLEVIEDASGRTDWSAVAIDGEEC